MKKFLAGVSGAAVAGIFAWQYAKRPRDIRWIDYVGELPHAGASDFAVVDGVRLHYQAFGEPEGRPVILLHGFCSSNYTWKDVVEPLAAAGYRVIAPDLKGFGFSEKPADRRYHVQDHAQLVIGLLDHLGISDAVFCGNSFGGATSLACALMWPHRVSRLILIDAAFNDEPLRQFPFSLYMQVARAWMVGEASVPLMLSSRGLAERAMRDFFYDQSVLTPERVAAYYRPARTSDGQQAAISTARQWDLNWIEQELDAIQTPTLIIWGECDKSIPVSLGVHLHVNLPHSEFVVIPDCGHLPQEERPEETVALMLDFCPLFFFFPPPPPPSLPPASATDDRAEPAPGTPTAAESQSA
jgi:pimeloyl-ACP methyl ester carboxylesterase